MVGFVVGGMRESSNGFSETETDHALQSIRNGASITEEKLRLVVPTGSVIMRRAVFWDASEGISLMRWYWIDRFVEFTSGVSATSIKNVTMAEEHLHDSLPDYPVMALPLVIEGIAQTGGLLACEKSGFSNKVVLAKIARAVFHREPLPGDTLRYTANLLSWSTDGSIVEATAVVEGRDGNPDEPLAELELSFAHLQGEEFEGRQLFGSQDLLRLFRVFGGYRVGRSVEGAQLADPELTPNDRGMNAERSGNER